MANASPADVVQKLQQAAYADLFRAAFGAGVFSSEERGREIFDDPARGNCSACHFAGAAANGSSQLFTDFSFSAIGVPRNLEIPAQADPGTFDLGICSRPDHSLPESAQYCGMFKTPTLRNVAIRKVFFHNGKMKSLREVLPFYNTRDTQPELWYPVVGGVVQKFDDLPAPYQTNIDAQAVSALGKGRPASRALVLGLLAAGAVGVSRRRPGRTR